MTLLSAILFVPLLGAVLIGLLKKEREDFIKKLAIAASLVVLLLSLYALAGFSLGVEGFQFEEQCPWIPQLGVSYHLGIDGVSLPMVVLTALLTFLVMVWNYTAKNRFKEYLIFFLVLETGMLGVFMALDMFLFFIFWEVSLVPMYFLIGIWGGPKKDYAALKFFLYTLAGSIAMLVGIFILYFNAVPHTLDFPLLLQLAPLAGNIRLAGLAFWLFFLGFAIKVPMFPFHTWLPDAHVEAPTPGSVILAGVLLKMGGYGFIRFVLPLLPEASRLYGKYVAVLALISIVYGALVTLGQRDFKKLIAYSSVSHMGYVMLGVSSVMRLGLNSPELVASAVTALNGAVLQMFNHGIATGALFFLVGVLYQRTHNRDLNKFGGLDVKMPLFAAILMVTGFASLGLPGLANFVSEFLVFLGSYPLQRGIVVAALLGILIGAAYILWMLQRILLGKPRVDYRRLRDLDTREFIVLAVLVALLVIIGIYPTPFLDVINSGSQAVLRMMGMLG